jgi:ABC-2 type transport system permease protein
MAAMAGTDVMAQLAYQQRIRAYHRALREFYYGYLFNDKPFGAAGLALAPRWSQRSAPP